MIINNLTDVDAKKIEEFITGLKETNPHIIYNVYKDEDPATHLDDKLKEICDKVDKIERKLNRIFKDYVIIGGEFTNIEDIMEGKQLRKKMKEIIGLSQDGILQTALIY